MIQIFRFQIYLKLIFSCFERADFSENVFLLKGSLVPQNNILITQTCVTFLLKKINIGESAGPYSICVCTLCYWADELRNVLTKLFQMLYIV